MIDNSFNKKSFLKSKGIYVLAALCILAAGAGVWGAVHVSKAPSKVDTSEQSSRQYNIDYLVPSETNNPQGYYKHHVELALLSNRPVKPQWKG